MAMKFKKIHMVKCIIKKETNIKNYIVNNLFLFYV